MQVSPAWLAALLLAVLITAITWKLATRASITWRRESEALAKTQPASAALVPDMEQPLLSHEGDGEASHAQGNAESSSAPARAIAPVAIPSIAFQSSDDHDEHHAHSPMAYSAVGSFTVGSSSTKPRYTSCRHCLADYPVQLYSRMCGYAETAAVPMVAAIMVLHQDEQLRLLDE